MDDEVVKALSTLRCPFAAREAELHAAVSECLEKAGISFQHEAKLGKGSRIDFLAGNTGIEIKKGKPDAERLWKQLKRYTQNDEIQSLVLVAPGLLPVPAEMNGKSIITISLNQLWGISLP